MAESILFLTGHLARPRLEAVLQSMQGSFDWKRFDGESIEVLHAKGPRGDLLQKFEPEFTELTGIEVGSEQVPEQQQRQKAVIEFTSGSTSFDVLMLSLHVQKRLVAKGR